MGELTLLLLRLGFLLLLWAFVFAVVYALRSDLFGQRARRMPAPVAASVAPPAAAVPPAAQPVILRPSADGTPARRLVITGGPREGIEIDLPAEQLTIGRSGESGLVIRDDYTSTHHARLAHRGDEWVIFDLDSTNGTFVDGVRVTVPTPVAPGVPVTIGTTTFELRR
jgi:pSer/pThr/pTyr-binding forkhead associated (FHA) protein